MGSLDDLLVVQQLDTRIDQLDHQRATLPARAELTGLQKARAAADEEIQECRVRLRVVRVAQKEHEDHAGSLDQKAQEIHTSLYDGSVTAVKELSALQDEHAMLKEHQAQFEDLALEQMELAEPIEEELSQLAFGLERIEAQIAATEAQIAVQETEIDVQLDDVKSQRETAARLVPADMLAGYETLRTQLGGVAVAELNGRRCEGCFLEIPSAQLEAVRHAPPEELAKCPECGRILVR